MSSRNRLGGVIHTYQQYDPQKFPSPTEPPPDLVSPAFEHMLAYGDMRELTEEELARAVHLDINQIAGLGPSLESLKQMLKERKEKILKTWETEQVQKTAAHQFHSRAHGMAPPKKLKDRFQQAVKEEQIRDLERLWYQAGDDQSRFARQLVQLIDNLGDKYQIDQLAAKYEFKGHKPMSISKALEIKEELETIDRLLKQLEEAAKNAKIAVIDLQELSQFANPEQMQELDRLQKQVEELMRQMAEQQGCRKRSRGTSSRPRRTSYFRENCSKRFSVTWNRHGREASRTDRGRRGRRTDAYEGL
ncbi:MAG: hypothetical protein U0903_11630 [Planctomycetales bacterium]